MPAVELRLLAELHAIEERPDAGMNLILKLAGQNPELEPIDVAAHYDGPLNSPGADDNATAVAAVLELARRWPRNDASSSGRCI